jgi:hypothetical protein
MKPEPLFDDPPPAREAHQRVFGRADRSARRRDRIEQPFAAEAEFERPGRRTSPETKTVFEMLERTTTIACGLCDLPFRPCSISRWTSNGVRPATPSARYRGAGWCLRIDRDRGEVLAPRRRIEPFARHARPGPAEQRHADLIDADGQHVARADRVGAGIAGELGEGGRTLAAAFLPAQGVHGNRVELHDLELQRVGAAFGAALDLARGRAARRQGGAAPERQARRGEQHGRRARAVQEAGHRRYYPRRNSPRTTGAVNHA